MRFLFLFTFHQLVDVWRKVANSASKVVMLRSGPRHGKAPPPHSQWRNQRFEPGGEFYEGGPLAIVWACNN